MVKHVTKTVKLLLLFCILLLTLFGIWLHEGERSIDSAKPWILKALNPPNAHYAISIGGMSIDWRDASKLGVIRFTNIAFTKPDGEVFAVLPEAYATIDPLGFLPQRRVLHKVFLNAPQLFMTRNARGTITLGLEDSKSPMPLASLFSTVNADAEHANEMTPPTLPFHSFEIADATLNFSDEATGTKIVSSPMSAELMRNRDSYEASLSLPLAVEGKESHLDAFLRAAPSDSEHVLNINLEQVPVKLLCVFGFCPDNVEGTGKVDGSLGVRIADDGVLNGVIANVTTKSATLIAPQWFEKPIVLGPSQLTAESDRATHNINLTAMKLALEDSTITGTGVAHHDDSGWTVNANAETGKLDVTKVYKYWPLPMAPDSRLWVTSKMKAGYVEKGTLKLALKPEDFAAPFFPDAAIAADVSARDITFDYLPGFPYVEHMNGEVHFTGTTVKIEGSGGTALTGTRITRSTLWCPDLNNPHIPMEARFSLSAPARDGATLLGLKHFTFDDSFGLDAAKITGDVDADIALKFDSFSNNKDPDPNAIHLENVSYDIAAILKNVAQEKLMGSYNVKQGNGVLKANNAGVNFDGSLALAETGISELSLSQPSGKPLSLRVKSAKGQLGKASNDFSLVYASGRDRPSIMLRGNRIDISQSYGASSGTSPLKNFPAMLLDAQLGEVILAMDAPLRQVVAALDCSKVRCDSADVKASYEKGDMQLVIGEGEKGRVLDLTASNAGNFLKALDVTDRMVGGALTVNGPYDDTKNYPALKARLLIKDFTLKNSQILGRILSIGSLTGLSNLLTGNGIAFDKLSANITSQAGIVTVDKGRANGTAMGLTLEGKVDTASTKMEMKGVVVPAYALNSMIGKIPLIGMLAGGDGEGLIAFNFSVNGTYNDPDVSVNPLSGLTPGFLRGIFKVFDGPSEIDDPEDESQPPRTTTPTPPRRETH